jgi:hypothetical protein
MAIIQISKIQQRSGNLVDLPQLDEAQFGWANDQKRLFIGTATPNPNENVEVLTAYSNITFGQLDGAYGNLNINIANSSVAANSVGEVLAFDGNNWINAGGNAGGTINLGDVANVKIGGSGGIGYILETDGLGNLSWTPKGTLYTNIVGLSNANPIVMTVANTVPYTNQQPITISGVNGASNSIVNGNTFYVKLASNYATTGNVTLYSDLTLTTPVNGAGLTYTNSPNAIATAIIGGGAGIGTPGGSNSCVQFNDSGTFGGNSGFTFNSITGVLAVPGNVTATNANLGNAVSANYFIGSGANLTNLPAGNISGSINLATYATTANSVAGANVSGAVSSATTAGTVTTAAQPNITSVGTLSSLDVSANIGTGGIKTDNYYYANGAAISFSGTYSNSNVSSYLPTYTGTVGATTLTTGSSATAGTITGNWALSSGSQLNATYADLAEYYEADQHYEPGTVLAFGGDKEVTIAEDGTTKVAGIVSTNPAYVMNSACEGEHIVALALQGRVPCKVRGNIKKGDMLISAGYGFARPAPFPVLGTVIGKSLENFDGIEGIIEVAVGRL